MIGNMGGVYEIAKRAVVFMIFPMAAPLIGILGTVLGRREILPCSAAADIGTKTGLDPISDDELFEAVLGIGLPKSIGAGGRDVHQACFALTQF